MKEKDAAAVTASVKMGEYEMIVTEEQLEALCKIKNCSLVFTGIISDIQDRIVVWGAQAYPPDRSPLFDAIASLHDVKEVYKTIGDIPFFRNGEEVIATL